MPKENFPSKKENPEIEIISGHTDVKESDKREGIDIYGNKPLGENQDTYRPSHTDEGIKKNEEILKRIALLEESFKNPNYVGDKSLIEEEIVKLENELSNSKFPLNKKLKTAKELAMEGKIAWEKGEKKEVEIKTVENKNTNTSSFSPEVETINETPEITSNPNIIVHRIPEEILNKNRNSKGENKEEKEEFSREELLNAAEIFCKFNKAGYYKDPEGAKVAEEKALKNLKAEHSDREIAAAIKVANKRNELSGIKDELKRIEKEYKTAKNDPYADSSVVSAKYKQQIQDIKDKILLIDNDYSPLLKELGVSNIDNQLKNLEKYEKDEDYNKKVQNARLFNLSIIQTEKLRYQDEQVATNSAINPKAWDRIKGVFKRGVESKMFQGYAKMGRFTRTALGAAIVGGGTAILWPSTIAAGLGVASFLAYRTVRGLVGGTLGFNLSKRIFQPMVRGSYGHDEKLTTQDQQGEAVKSTEMSNLEKLKDEKDSEKRAQTLEGIYKENIDLCDKYKDRIAKNKKLFKRNNLIVGTLVPGFLGGFGGAVLTDWVAGPGVLGVLPVHRTGATENFTDDNHSKGGATPGKTTPNTEGSGPKGGADAGRGAGKAIMPGDTIPGGGKGIGPGMIDKNTLEMATVGEGEGVEHVFRRQLEANPTKFGFDGDITDKTAIHQWSGGKAHLIAIDQGYVKGDVESWVRDMGVDGPKGNPAYPIDIDASGKITVTEYFDGKPSGAGGLNSPYEYEHSSPRYSSALENVPDGESELVVIPEIQPISPKPIEMSPFKTPRILGNGLEYIEPRPVEMSSGFYQPPVLLGVDAEKVNSLIHGLANENLTTLKVNIPEYATVLNVSPTEVETALTGLGKTKDIVGSISKMVTENPTQARLLSAMLEAEPNLNSNAQGLKSALDKAIETVIYRKAI